METEELPFSTFHKVEREMFVRSAANVAEMPLLNRVNLIYSLK